jgi:hypothetical protein
MAGIEVNAIGAFGSLAHAAFADFDGDLIGPRRVPTVSDTKVADSAI